MANRFYIDTCIWRDYYENRSDNFRPLGEWALKFLKEAVNNDDLILYSDLTIKELCTKYTPEEIKNIFEVIEKRDILTQVNIIEPQVKEAMLIRTKRNLAFGDVLHAILARDNNAMLITRDEHFLELNDLVTIKKPEELI